MSRGEMLFGVPGTSTGSLLTAACRKKGAALQMGVQELLEAHPEASQQEYCQWWEATHGIQVSRATMSRAIHAMGWVRKKEKSPNQSVP